MTTRIKVFSYLLGAMLLPLAMNASAADCTTTLINGVKVQDTFSFPVASYSSPFWSSTQIYNQNQLVQQDGLQYQARWWNQGNQPGSDAGEVWKMTVGFNGKPQPWQANQVYYANEQTNYQNRRYTAKWWVKGEVPGTGTSWTAGEILDPLVLVKLSGSYRRDVCKISTQPDTYKTTITVNWAITQGQSTVAYWKIMREDAYRPIEMWAEMKRGTEKSGTLSYDTSTVTIGQRLIVHLCSADNTCRRVVGSDGTFF